jgi:hypothetical protein
MFTSLYKKVKQIYKNLRNVRSIPKSRIKKIYLAMHKSSFEAFVVLDFIHTNFYDEYHNTIFDHITWKQ